MLPEFGSKKWRAKVEGYLVTPLAFLITFLTAKLGLDLPQETCTELATYAAGGVIFVVSTYILGQGWADAGKEAVAMKAAADLLPYKREPEE